MAAVSRIAGGAAGRRRGRPPDCQRANSSMPRLGASPRAHPLPWGTQVRITVSSRLSPNQLELTCPLLHSAGNLASTQHASILLRGAQPAFRNRGAAGSYDPQGSACPRASNVVRRLRKQNTRQTSSRDDCFRHNQEQTRRAPGETVIAHSHCEWHADW